VREIRGGVPGNDRKVMCYKCKGVKTHHQRSKPFLRGIAYIVILQRTFLNMQMGAPEALIETAAECHQE